LVAPNVPATVEISLTGHRRSFARHDDRGALLPGFAVRSRCMLIIAKDGRSLGNALASLRSWILLFAGASFAAGPAGCSDVAEESCREHGRCSTGGVAALPTLDGDRDAVHVSARTDV
jgi:hypothetical protein